MAVELSLRPSDATEATEGNAEPNWARPISTNEISRTAKAWILTGPSLTAQNDGHPQTVKIKQLGSIEAGNEFKYTLPARSIVAMEIDAQ